jgi:hypothetical protein
LTSLHFVASHLQSQFVEVLGNIKRIDAYVDSNRCTKGPETKRSSTWECEQMSGIYTWTRRIEIFGCWESHPKGPVASEPNVVLNVPKPRPRPRLRSTQRHSSEIRSPVCCASPWAVHSTKSSNRGIRRGNRESTLYGSLCYGSIPIIFIPGQSWRPR